MALTTHFRLPKTLHSSKQFAFFVKFALFAIFLPLALSNGVTWDRNKRSNFRLSHSSSQRKNWIKLIPKTIENRKRDCAWGCARGINTTWENLQIEKHKSGGVRSSHRTDLCFSISRFSQVVFIPRVQPHAQSLFLFPIVFGINTYCRAENWKRFRTRLPAHLVHFCGVASGRIFAIFLSSTVGAVGCNCR